MITEGKTFFEQYRIATKEDGSLQELGRSGVTVTYKALDIRSGEPVAVKLLPLASVEPAARAQLEEQARTAKLLDHINIAKLHAFGIEDDHFVYVSEYPQGETVDSWIAAHGPMPPEAVLRVALQVVSALGAASFHGIKHRAIQPSNLGIVPGQTAEGGWPFVKLMSFDSAGVKLETPNGASSEIDSSVAIQFASPEQLEHGTVDFQSELYSLGATMCFLLTGALYPAESRQQQLRRFPRPVRDLLSHMLRTKPEERPQDRVAFEEEIRECLQRIERRQALGRRFGLAFVPVIPRKTPQPRAWLPRRGLAFAAIALALVALASILLPEDFIRTVLPRNRDIKKIGVPVGVPDASPAAIAQNVLPAPPAPPTSSAIPSPVPITSTVPAQAMANATPAAASENLSPPPVAQSPAVAVASPPATPAPAVAAAGPGISPSGQIAAVTPAAEPAPPAEAPEDQVKPPRAEFVAPPDSDDEEIANSKVVAKDSVNGPRSKNKKQAASSSRSVSKARGKTRTVATTPKRRYPPRIRRGRIVHGPSDYHPHGPGSVRADFVGTTPDGRVILRLPSGRTAIVAPPPVEEYAPMEHPQHRVHTTIETERTILWPPPFMRIFPPDE